MAGGEPLIISQHTYFLERCIALNRAGKIVLEYNTNITVLPSRVLELWKQFKQVRVGASVDGFGVIQEYQRWPIKWSHTLKNLQKLDDLSVESSNILPHIALTVTAYNAFHLPEFIWWKLTESKFQKINSMARRPVITYHMAHQPHRMSVQMYPESIRTKLTIHYNSWIEKINHSDLPDHIKDASIDILASVLLFMNLEYRTDAVNDFVKLTKFLDKKRNQDIMSVVPELGELFEE
jgi:sulfatase maturation enzyme AslB (radical SAM superfamily)